MTLPYPPLWPYRRRRLSYVLQQEPTKPMPNPVTELTIVDGAAPTAGPDGNHIVVYDQKSDALPPAAITWALDPSIAAVAVAPDPTGFFFTAPAGTAAATGNANATYTVNGVTGSLAVTINVVTSLVFSRE